jgi:hypothetical protein
MGLFIHAKSCSLGQAAILCWLPESEKGGKDLAEREMLLPAVNLTLDFQTSLSTLLKRTKVYDFFYHPGNSS